MRLPTLVRNVPLCSYEHCPQYDGKRCGELGFSPHGICEPEVREVFTRVIDGGYDKTKSKDFIVYMLLWCPECGERHIDEGEFETRIHHTHACQSCGHVWRPALGATCGVRFLPGFKNGKGAP